MKRKRRIMAGRAILVILLVAGSIPLYAVYRKWDLRRTERQARQSLAAGKFGEARELAQEVLRAKQDDPAMLKVIHAAMVAQKDPGAAELARYLIRESSSDEASRLDGFRDVCAELPLPRVFHSWLTLPAADRNLAAYVKPFATRLIEQSMPEDADQILQQYLQASDDPELHLLQIRAWLATGTPGDLSRAQKKIAGLMDQGGTSGLAAFRLLSQVPLDQFRSGYFLEIAPWLEQQQGATAADKLLGHLQPLQRTPAEKPRIVAEVVKSQGSRDPVACARWLRGLGMSRDALELGNGVDPAAWAPVKADLFADLGLWKDLEEWLSTAPAGLTPVEIATRRVIAAGKLGDETLRREQWDFILAESKVIKTSNVLLDVAVLTHAAGMEEVSREALLEAVMLQRGRLPFWNSIRSLVPWLRKADRGDRLASLCQIMAELDFTTPEPQLEWIDLSNLEEKSKPAAALKLLDELAKNYPKLVSDSRYHEVRATVLLVDGKAKEALAALGDSRQSSRLPTPRRTTISILAKADLATREIPSSGALRSLIPWTDLIREERDFFNRRLHAMDAKFIAVPPPAAPQESPVKAVGEPSNESLAPPVNR
jgi:hypothetical protein